MARDDMNSDARIVQLGIQTGATIEIPREKQDRAALYIATHVDDANDRAVLLDMLGLTDATH